MLGWSAFLNYSGCALFVYTAKLHNFADDVAESWEKICKAQEIAVPLQHQPRYVEYHSQSQCRGHY